MQAAGLRTWNVTLAAPGGGPGERDTVGSGPDVLVALASRRQQRRGVSSANVRCEFVLEIPRFLEITVQGTPPRPAPPSPPVLTPTLWVLAPGSLHRRARSVLSSAALAPASTQCGKLQTGRVCVPHPPSGARGASRGRGVGVPSPKPSAENQTGAKSLLPAPSGPRCRAAAPPLPACLAGRLSPPGAQGGLPCLAEAGFPVCQPPSPLCAPPPAAC